MGRLSWIILVANVINHRGPYKREVGGSGSAKRCGEVEAGSLKMEKGSRTQGIQVASEA